MDPETPRYKRILPDFHLDVAIPSDWTDVTNQGDTTPSWEAPNGLRIIVDHADEETREHPGLLRFLVLKRDNNNLPTDVVFISDSWDDVIAYVEGDLLTRTQIVLRRTIASYREILNSGEASQEELAVIRNAIHTFEDHIATLQRFKTK